MSSENLWQRKMTLDRFKNEYRERESKIFVFASEERKPKKKKC